ncbi:MAG: bifunctional adenosylcobinamide kinase/adenosylcobinamide-phosphate guanylyltransferase [Oscillospiraceae bacterium]|nr:bifunctional adenosylcobinamide kinase/adenosylcobinamide-phosphate guanylyltransferase [Oscillospiraceae bacterium]
MMILITGGSKCGKSSFAEKLLQNISENKYYLATMKPFGEDAHQAITRHQEMRRNKNFITIEQYTDIDKINLPEHSAVLLECMGNLCANEMFQEDKIFYPVEKIIKNLNFLHAMTDMLVIVTNEVGMDGISYSAETMQYISAMAELNQKTAQIADTVIECVCGIPLVIKGEIPC